MALGVCVLLDDDGDRAVRELWRRLEEAGVPTLLSHTHGRHVPHLTYAALRDYDLDAVRAALSGLAGGDPARLHLDALGMFRRSRCWLAPAVTGTMLVRQAELVAACTATGADLHQHYRPGTWIPHLTLAPRLRLEQLPVVARHVNEVLPLVVGTSGLALVDTTTGDVHRLG